MLRETVVILVLSLHQFLFPPYIPGEAVLCGCEMLSLNMSSFLWTSKSDLNLALQESV